MLRYYVPGFSHFHLANPILVTDHAHECERVMSAARKAGLTTSLDTAWDAMGRWIEDIGPCLPFTDLLFVNDSEAGMLTGSEDPRIATRIFRETGASDVVIKLGPRGCIVFAGDCEHESPGFAVTAKDTTGAGDCFVGAFLAAIHRGLDLP